MKFKTRIATVIFFLITCCIGILLFLFGILYVIPEISFRRYNSILSVSKSEIPLEVAPVKQQELLNTMERLRRKLDRLNPSGTFLVINTTENTFKLYQKNRIILNGLCSTGSMIHLEADSTRSWLFETPKGVFTVRNKMENPVWRKPDWAFIEEGLEVPPPNDPQRFERGVLGDYALNLGNGYLIHGTLYQRLLGMPVTHGCIRLNDSDLSSIYHSLEVGSKVFIY